MKNIFHWADDVGRKKIILVEQPAAQPFVECEETGTEEKKEGWLSMLRESKTAPADRK